MKTMILALLSSPLILLFIGGASDFEMQKHWVVLALLFPVTFWGSLGFLGRATGGSSLFKKVGIKGP